MKPGAWGLLTPLAGGRDGKFFAITPAYVDVSKKPGYSSKETPTLYSMLWNALTLRHLWASPYLIWLVISLLFNRMWPYDLSPLGAAHASPTSAAFFLARLPPLLVVVFAYYIFFHTALYFWGWSKRPFVRDRVYAWSKTFHNAFFVAVGVVIWVAVENVVCHLWARGRLPYFANADALSTTQNALMCLGIAAFMPVWRASHFFIGHHFIHYPALYASIHRLHHRNADPDVFAGLAMHPVEHLWFYACTMPVLWLRVPPFAFFFIGMSCLISPACSHSGYEDIMQSDVHHYMHHRFFEVNYASFDASSLDVLFGTYRESFADVSGKDADKGLAAVNDEKSALGVPPLFDSLYVAGIAAGFAPWYVACSGGGAAAPPIVLGAIAGFTPIALAYMMPRIGTVGGAKSKGAAVDTLLWTLGALSSAVPVTLACYLCLA
jgi:sterol desaturase/sphingolipid hydroxylase (fatty acid hydroxylase superfamily)